MKKTTRTLMLALAATVITGSAYAQVDSTKSDSTDSTVIKSDSTSTPPTEDKKKDEKTPPHAFVAPQQSNTLAWVATRELMGNKAVEVEKEEA
ncbi:hypothetical protein A8C56_09955 [Niabella ginsenosidivorans]|uniref:Uncharacterized protein n=1 Tax=Niabella ginsenosidivorans TaxID=1176587 RepID=A0A1A9I1Q7_9BACT|nr:hypothetical protein [Niabella ginsenosidivorans]ANH81265.1 hypothetical protein A8C56_09955 [Niabella ginsenosidivorans]